MPPVADRSRVYRSEAVILRRMDLGEADRLLTVFTPNKGKVRAIAKGVRRPGSRKAGHLELFTRSRLLLARGRELDIVTQAETIDAYSNLREDLDRLGQAAYVVELIDRFGIAESDSHALYHLTTSTLERLDSEPNFAIARRYFQMRLLDLVGYRPELFRCVSCSNEALPEDQFFSASEGGLLCPECGPRHHTARPLSLGALKVMRHYQRHSYAQASQPRVSAAVGQELDDLMESYLSHLIERELHVPSFVRQVQRVREANAEN